MACLLVQAAPAAAEVATPVRFAPAGVAGPSGPLADPLAGALPALRVAVPVPAPAEADGPGRLAEFGPLGLPCGARLVATPAPGATVRLRLEAPCLPGVLVTVDHGALSAGFLLSGSGVVETVFPAFAEDALYAVRLPGGERIEARAHVPGAAGYERVVTMWEGAGALSVHAYEFGAGEAQDGHVWRGAPRGALAAEAGRGGYLLTLGAEEVEGARRAEVYSFPAAEAARTGTVRFALAAAVTPATCGRALEAQTLQLGDGLPGAPVTLSIALPDCGAAAGDLVLKNLARDLKIAAR